MQRLFSTIAKEAALEGKGVRPCIQLSEWETKIFRFLRRVAAVTRTSANPVELRVAGGWVRDKLLGRCTGDIDIAVRHVTGFQFASRLHSFATAVSQKRSTDARKRGVRSEDLESFTFSMLPNVIKRPRIGCAEYVPDMSAVALIAPNPSISRHLETATVRLDGVDLDFVQLRTEDYAMSANNRIPCKVSAGTPQEDCTRRDFTVNALYYNIHTEIVEDFTGRGLDDLKRGLLRTPLNPQLTLLEDPLRAVRAIRFACTLNFELHPSLCDAISSTDVRASLSRKVSRERIGSEITQIIRSDAVIKGFEMIAKYGLEEVVFMETFESLACSTEAEYAAGVARVQLALIILNSCAGWIKQEELNDFWKYGREVLILAVLLYDTNRTQTALHKALRKKKSLQQDTRRVILLSIRLEEAARLWYLFRMNPEEQEQEEQLWIELAKTVRKAGDQLWIAAAIAASVRVENMDMLLDLVNAGIDSRLCRVSYAMDGRRLQKELGLQPGPEVGRALNDLMHIQLWYLRRRRDEVRNREKHSSPTVEEYLRLLKANRMKWDQVRT